MSHWKFEDQITNTKILRLGKALNNLTNRNFPGIQTNSDKFFSLYVFLLKHIDENPLSLMKRITQNGNPIFDASTLEQIQKQLRTQKNTKIAQYFIQRGGGVELDETRTKFWDKAIHKITKPISDAIPPSWDGVMYYAYILYHLEQMEFVGPLISTGLDVISLSLPVAAEIVSETVEKVVGLAPIPYAAFVGEAVGYAISLVLIAFAVVINTSRKHFGSGFKASLEAVPIIGDVLMDAAQSVETGADRYLASRKKLLASINKVSPHTGEVIDYYTPDVAIKEGPAPVFDYRLAKADVANFLLSQSGIDDVLNSTTNATSNLGKTMKNSLLKRGGHYTRKRRTATFYKK